MNKTLSDLIKVSNAAGKDPAFVQGGGGNTSLKTEDGKHMFIKASGTALKFMSPNKGWRRIELAPIFDMMKDKELPKLPANIREPEVVNRLLAACDDTVTDGSRPSVEAHLHAFLGKCVIHLHPNAIGAYVNAKNGKALLPQNTSPGQCLFVLLPQAQSGFVSWSLSLLKSDCSKGSSDHMPDCMNSSEENGLR